MTNPRKHPPFTGYSLYQLAKAVVKPEHLTRGLDRLQRDGGIEPALIAMMYQLGRLDEMEARFLMKVKHPHRPKLDMNYAAERACLCHRMVEDLTAHLAGERVRHPVPCMRRNIAVDRRVLSAKKKQARERLKAEIRAKRGM